jgi:hypothetical protein
LIFHEIIEIRREGRGTGEKTRGKKGKNGKTGQRKANFYAI